MFRVALGALIFAATLILMITRPARFCCCASRRTEQSAMLWRVMAYNVRKLTPGVASVHGENSRLAHTAVRAPTRHGIACIRPFMEG